GALSCWPVPADVVVMALGEFSLSTSKSLIHRARGMDADAWNVLTRLYGPLIYGWARRAGLQSEDAADILQNVFVSVWRGLPRFHIDRPESSFRGWLRVITRNAMSEWGRRRQALVLSGSALNGLEAARGVSDRAVAPDDSAEEMFSGLTHQA